jgi:hypothetical protein
MHVNCYRAGSRTTCRRLVPLVNGRSVRAAHREGATVYEHVYHFLRVLRTVEAFIFIAVQNLRAEKCLRSRGFEGATWPL